MKFEFTMTDAEFLASMLIAIMATLFALAGLALLFPGGL